MEITVDGSCLEHVHIEIPVMFVTSTYGDNRQWVMFATSAYEDKHRWVMFTTSTYGNNHRWVMFTTVAK